MNYDLALIKLKNSVNLDKFGQIACLPDETDILVKSAYLTDNVSVVTPGWEYFYGGAGYTWSEFHQSILNVSHPDCHDLYTNTTDPSQIICTR